jgi:hypothetical protein
MGAAKFTLKVARDVPTSWTIAAAPAVEMPAADSDFATAGGNPVCA